VCWFDEQVYPADSSTPARARRFALDQLRRAFGDEAQVTALGTDAGLIVSELVTNAVNAGATRIGVALAIHHGHLRIGIADDASGRPTVQTASPHATGGRGLHIVEQLARRWGTCATPGGKEIWAELSVEPAATAVPLNCTI